MASSLIEQPRFACALSAQHTVLAIPKAHPILHSGPGCSENSFKFTVISGGHQGGGVAAPVGGQIFSEILPYLEINHNEE